MTSNKLILPIVVAGLLAATSSSLAAEREFCRDYATAALRQVRVARDIDDCLDRDARESTRWSRDYRVHFDWCRGVSRDAADAERDVRTDRVRECRR